MARSRLRARGPTDSIPPLRSVAPVLLAGLTACVAYEPAPVDPAALLAELEALPLDASVAAAEGAVPVDRLAAFAVTHQPALAATRAGVGIARAALVEAGRLEDPELGWDGMAALAAQIVEGTSTSLDVIGGLELAIPVPRPGERDAVRDAARGRLEQARREVVDAEWRLVRDVYLAAEDVLEAEALLAQARALREIADRTRQYFERALEAGVATAVEASLATGDGLAVAGLLVQREAAQRAARQRLNALLGVSPATKLAIAPASLADAGADPEDPEALVESALDRRPDLAVLLAAYQVAEDELRAEVARQFPELRLGTGIWIVPGLFTAFHRPAIATARARRAALGLAVRERVHEVRREIHAACAALLEARAELRFLEEERLPNAEQSLRLADQAFRDGELTLLERLAVQRVVVEVRTRTTEARAELRRRRWSLLSATGALLPPTPGEREHEVQR